jgi:hypothetical protein
LLGWRANVQYQACWLFAIKRLRATKVKIWKTLVIYTTDKIPYIHYSW